MQVLWTIDIVEHEQIGGYNEKAAQTNATDLDDQKASKRRHSRNEENKIEILEN